MARAEKALLASPADLWRVAETNDTRTLEWILSSGIDVDARNEHGTTALMRAAYHGRLQMVEALIALGADPNAVRHDNFTPLTLAAFFGHTDIVRALVQAGAETDRVTRNGTSARMWASARTFQAVAKYLDAVQPAQSHTDASRGEEGAVAIEEQEPEIIEAEWEYGPSEEVAIHQDSRETARDDLPEFAPLVKAHAPARFIPVRRVAFVALLVMASLVAIALLLRVQQPDIQMIQTTAAGPPLEPKVEDLALKKAPAPETQIEQSASSVTEVEENKVPRVPVRNVAHRSRRLVSDSTTKAKQSVSARPNNDVASDPVDKASPTSKRTVPPLSTQLVSSPSKSATKPKVIQWP